MRKIIVPLLVVLSLSFSVMRKKKFLPPGSAQITDTFYADETEITNLAWSEFETWTKIKFGPGSAEHLSTLPDTLVWKNKSGYIEPYVQLYYRHPAYRDYPVVGISYDQAVEFCKWRTERVKEQWYLFKKKTLNIEYRLPTKQEWEMISNNGIGIFTLKDGRDEKGRRVLNCVWDDDTLGVAGTISDNADVTAPAYSYWPNRFGLFCTFGNVSEMVSEKGVSKGGSWRNRLEECRAGKDLPYSKPTAWLGFRCVCEIRNSGNS